MKAGQRWRKPQTTTDALGLAIDQVDHLQRRGFEIDAETCALLPGVDIVLWAQGLRGPLTTTAIRARWNVHKATACRWMHQLQSVYNAAQAIRARREESPIEQPSIALTGGETA